MSVPSDVLALENRRRGAPTLAAAYDRLQELWEAGTRDREVCLHLLFLAWYGLVEPTHITGFADRADSTATLATMFTDVFQYCQSGINDDAEMLYVIGLMAYLFPYMLGPERDWELLAVQYRERYRALMPTGIDPAIFDQRGAYGAYFAGQARIIDGY